MRVVSFLGMILSGFIVYNSIDLINRMYKGNIPTGDALYFAVVMAIGLVSAIVLFEKTFL